MDSPSAKLVEPSMIDNDGPPSSPFVTEVDAHSRSPSKQWKPTSDDIMKIEDLYEEKENVPQQLQEASPVKKHSTPEPAQAKVDASLRSSKGADLMPPPSTGKVSSSPKKTPLKSSRDGTSTPRSVSRGSSDEQSTSSFQAGLDARNALMTHEDPANMDDTCFSTFSEIPDMTVFAKLRQSPTKQMSTPGDNAEPTPRVSRKRSSPSRSPSPTPRRQKTPATASNRGDDTTNFLIDFTQQLEGVTSRQPSPIKSSTESNLLQYINSQRSPAKSSPTKPIYTTPNKTMNNNLMNLLDFELPPAPTPRSVPTITVRELESLKSSYLSQISSLKATLSGREAEVDSLKKAVNDAERRVGEAQETLGDEKNRREHFEQEVSSWKKRSSEFESVLKSVKEEVLKSEREKEDTNSRLEEAEKRAEEADVRAVKAEERFADALAARASGADGSEDGIEEQVQRLVSAQIDAKIEAVSRELHTVYKEKHERKVATLKKSYEARNEKKTAELQSRVSELEKANEELQVGRDSTFSGPAAVGITADKNTDLKAQLEEQKAAFARLESEIQWSQSQQDQLQSELKQERIEKGDLVAAVDEMLALQAENPPAPTPSGMRAMSVVEDFRKSISRPPAGLSGLKPPGAGGAAAGESKIGRGLPQPAAMNRSTSGGKSRMLANIERMGRTGSYNSGSGVE